MSEVCFRSSSEKRGGVGGDETLGVLAAPWGPAVRTQQAHCHGQGPNPWLGNLDPTGRAAFSSQDQAPAPRQDAACPFFSPLSDPCPRTPLCQNHLLGPLGFLKVSLFFTTMSNDPLHSWATPPGPHLHLATSHSSIGSLEAASARNTWHRCPDVCCHSPLQIYFRDRKP